jgi:hypothetical protein
MIFVAGYKTPWSDIREGKMINDSGMTGHGIAKHWHIYCYILLTAAWRAGIKAD